MLDEGELAITEVLQVLQDLRLPPAVKPAGRIGVFKEKLHGKLRKVSWDIWTNLIVYGNIMVNKGKYRRISPFRKEKRIDIYFPCRHMQIWYIQDGQEMELYFLRNRGACKTALN